MTLVMPAPGSTNRASEFRPADDYYPTPRGAIVPFIKAVPLPNPIWECACGAGALADVLIEHGHDVIATNLTDRGYGEAGIDFLKEREIRGGAQSIVTNPPFAIFNDFALNALAMEPRMLALFGRLKLLEGMQRYLKIMRPHPPAFVYVFVDRIKFYAGDTPEADQPGWNSEAFAWFVWLRRWPHEPVIRWLRTNDGLQPDLFGEAA